MGTQAQWFNPAAFSMPTAGTWGNEGRGAFNGPGLAEVDMSIFKNTALTEKVALALRAEFFNILNHPNFASPILPAFAADIGSPDLATGRHSGFYPLQATGDVGIGNPFLGGGGPRGIQFSAQLKF